MSVDLLGDLPEDSAPESCSSELNLNIPLQKLAPDEEMQGIYGAESTKGVQQVREDLSTGVNLTLPSGVECIKGSNEEKPNKRDHTFLFDRPFYIFFCDTKFCTEEALFASITKNTDNFQEAFTSIFTNIYNNTGIFCYFNHCANIQQGVQFKFLSMIGITKNRNPRIGFLATWESSPDNQFNAKCTIGFRQGAGQEFSLRPVFDLTFNWTG